MSGKQNQFPTGRISLFFFVIGPVLGAALFFTLKSLGWGSDACLTATVSAVCAVWWVFEPVPIPATSLLPFALFPVLGVLSPRGAFPTKVMAREGLALNFIGVFIITAVCVVML